MRTKARDAAPAAAGTDVGEAPDDSVPGAHPSESATEAESGRSAAKAESGAAVESSSPRGSRGWGLAGRVILELVIVFVGVYAAFALSEFEDRRDADLRREQLKAALVSEIRDITGNSGRVAAALPGLLVRFDSAVAVGARPPLEPWLEPVRVQAHMWEATLQSGALDIFDVAMVHHMSRFYNELNAGFAQMEQLRYLSESLLLPALGEDSDEFYDDADELRPKYRWYREGLERLAELAATITAQGDSLVLILER